MRILTYEFASSGIMKSEREILVEGFSMLRLVSNGLVRAGNSVFTMLNDDARTMGEVNSKVIPCDENLARVAKELDIDYVFPIAPDSGLADIVEGLDSEGILCISPDAKAIRMAADKLETYRILKRAGIDTPEMVGSDSGDYPLIAKNRYGVGCEGLRIINCGDEVPSDSDIIIQEFIRGGNASVVLFSDGTDAVPVSLNRQDIEFKRGRGAYLGGEVPFKHPLGKEALDVAKKAVESIPGLKGCVGVDLVIADRPYVIEINPRVTTSMIAVELASGLNVGKTALESLRGELPKPPEFGKRIRFRKEFSEGVCMKLRFEEV